MRSLWRAAAASGSTLGIGILAAGGQTGSDTLTASSNFLFDNETHGALIRGMNPWLIEDTISAQSPDAFGVTEDATDSAGDVRTSNLIIPTGVGDSDGKGLVYIPATSTPHGVGAGGADIGANLVYRRYNGAASTQKLWNQRTGAFPCGAIVSGVNDVAGKSCFDLHKRMRVGVAGCAIP
ncbi:hypothetical protein BH11MYX2_BH11MYX2_24860 [soil metagenome]